MAEIIWTEEAEQWLKDINVLKTMLGAKKKKNVWRLLNEESKRNYQKNGYIPQQ